jgi:hypothetical protein
VKRFRLSAMNDTDLLPFGASRCDKSRGPSNDEHMPMKRQLAALLVLLAGSAAAEAQERFGKTELDPVFDATIAISGSLGQAWTDSTLRLDASDGTRGTSLDGERDLGLDANETTGRMEVTLRPRPRHRVRLGLNYLPSDRSASKAAIEDIFFGDNIYAAGDEVRSKLQIRTWSATYGYSFLRNPRAEVAASVGVTSVDLVAEVGVPARALKETEERSFPAPQFGLEAAVKFAERWYGEARYQYVRINASNASGELSQLDAAVVFQFDHNIGAGLAYVQIDGDVKNEQFGDSGRLAYSNRGPQLFLRVSF